MPLRSTATNEHTRAVAEYTVPREYDSLSLPTTRENQDSVELQTDPETVVEQSTYYTEIEIEHPNVNSDERIEVIDTLRASVVSFETESEPDVRGENPVKATIGLVVTASFEGSGATVGIISGADNVQSQIDVKIPPAGILAIYQLFSTNPRSTVLRNCFELVFPESYSTKQCVRRMMNYYHVIARPDEYIEFRRILAEMIHPTRHWSPTINKYLTSVGFPTAKFTREQSQFQTVPELVRWYNQSNTFEQVSVNQIFLYAVATAICDPRMSVDVIIRGLPRDMSTEFDEETPLHRVFENHKQTLWGVTALLYASDRRELAKNTLLETETVVSTDEFEQQYNNAIDAKLSDKVSEWGKLLPTTVRDKQKQVEYIVGQVLFQIAGDFGFQYNAHSTSIDLYKLTHDFLREHNILNFASNAMARAKYIRGNQHLNGDNYLDASEAYYQAIRHSLLQHQSSVDHYVTANSIEYYTTAVLTAVQNGSITAQTALEQMMDLRDEVTETVASLDNVPLTQQSDKIQFLEAGVTECLAYRLQAKKEADDEISPTTEQIDTQLQHARQIYDDIGKQRHAQQIKHV